MVVRAKVVERERAREEQSRECKRLREKQASKKE